jgi:hypothetical protein
MRESQDQAVVDSEKTRHWQALIYGLECEVITQLLSGYRV